MWYVDTPASWIRRIGRVRANLGASLAPYSGCGSNTTGIVIVLINSPSKDMDRR
jgi:hypothetical protein